MQVGGQQDGRERISRFSTFFRRAKFIIRPCHHTCLGRTREVGADNIRIKLVKIYLVCINIFLLFI